MESKKFTAEELFEIAKDEYRKAGLEATAEGAGAWAAHTAEEDGRTEEDLRDELRTYIADELMIIVPIYPQPTLSEARITRIALRLYQAVQTGEANMAISNTVHDNVETIEVELPDGDVEKVETTWYEGGMVIGDDWYRIDTYFTAEEMAKNAQDDDHREEYLPWDDTTYTVKLEGVLLCEFCPR